MNLPQYYLADLPPEAEVTPALIQEAWLALQRNRKQHLASMTTQAIIRNLEDAAAVWLQPDSPYLNLAARTGIQQLGYSERSLMDGLKALFSSITASQLEAWVEQDLGHPDRLDAFCASGPERSTRRRSKAVGAPTLAQVSAGNIPPSTVLSMVAGVLVRSAQFVKCATGCSLVPRLFAHSIREVNPHLAACIEIAEWPRERVDLFEAFLEPAECVTATGTDAAVASLRQQVPIAKRFVSYGHRVSFAYVAADALALEAIESVAARVAEDVCAWNQLGCLSPHVVYVEQGGAVSAEQFAEQLASALAALDRSKPRGAISDAEAATIRSRRAFYEVRAAHSRDTVMWQSAGSTAWTVVFESNPLFQASCLNRFVYVKATVSVEAALQGADPVRHQVSTVGIAGSAARTSELATRLADWGVPRVCPIGCMQKPPVTWRHDGRPALSELVRWTDWEAS